MMWLVLSTHNLTKAQHVRALRASSRMRIIQLAPQSSSIPVETGVKSTQVQYRTKWRVLSVISPYASALCSSASIFFS